MPEHLVQEMVQVIMVMVLGIGIPIGLFAGVTVVKAVSRRLEGGRSSSVSSEATEQLAGRVAELEGLERRVMELEERLDFAERLLAERQGSPRHHLERL